MCIGIPMQVIETQPGHALVQGRGEVRRVNTALVGEPRQGDWLLIFLDAAREALSPSRAAEVNATLDLLDAAMAGLDNTAQGSAAFELPSAMSAEQLAALTGAPARG
ncbi:MAG: HypC/HybG/HupF family hydrogenase formation chaperone [Burkholderiales bacterium]|jgi:hydrogenase expression/formation protein HypC|nr:HypC/HybG/HupF family hydrogenase formation chaperone [Burkholderiales bacterium]MBP6250505.1 HypC/HybG/HupF family hydrogenase formation chaperone [Leptothrix sp. (in: b-proteobacteria)]MBP7522223.1 HypC/HybG/HupF family hydrogenase formation chaperone [Leptothrix sp. (in: b-proteobacteria)]